ncbi:MAG: HAD family phosphatase [Clostridia bacterium]|nr:HAD family phosphatase [Clostridia bacterium]
MTPYVFFLDIDDTILYKKDKADPGTVSERVLSAMKTARQMGHKVFINTGRAPSYFTDTIRAFPVDGYVCGCGAYLLENGKVLYQANYPDEAILKWMERLSNPDDPGIIVEGVDGGDYVVRLLFFIFYLLQKVCGYQKKVVPLQKIV